MITKTPAYQTSDGNTYPTLEIAQRAELLKLLRDGDDEQTGISEVQANPILHVLFNRLDEVKEILRATGRKSRKKANGAKRTRKAVEKGVQA
jgi:hypothetical protein